MNFVPYIPNMFDSQITMFVKTLVLLFVYNTTIELIKSDTIIVYSLT